MNADDLVKKWVKKNTIRVKNETSLVELRSDYDSLDPSEKARFDAYGMVNQIKLNLPKGYENGGVLR